jgi:hypothetical protein
MVIVPLIANLYDSIAFTVLLDGWAECHKAGMESAAARGVLDRDALRNQRR